MTSLPDDVHELVQQIHDSPTVCVLAVTGAGANALAWLLAVPGASRTLLEGRVPYARTAMIELLGAEPEDYVSKPTAVAMARAAHARAQELQRLDNADAPALGVACTGTIATDRPKRGEHRCWIAVCDGATTTSYGLMLNKGARDRAGEEAVVSRLVLRALAAAGGLLVALDPLLLVGEQLEASTEPG